MKGREGGRRKRGCVAVWREGASGKQQAPKACISLRNDTTADTTAGQRERRAPRQAQRWCVWYPQLVDALEVLVAALLRGGQGQVRGGWRRRDEGKVSGEEQGKWGNGLAPCLVAAELAEQLLLLLYLLLGSLLLRRQLGLVLVFFLVGILKNIIVSMSVTV